MSGRRFLGPTWAPLRDGTPGHSSAGWRATMPTGELAADDTCVYSKELYDAESMAADRLAQMIRENRPLFTPRNELEEAIARAE